MAERAASGEARIRRFGAYRIVEHLVLIGLFVVLVVTGLPQKFHMLGVAQSLIIVLGGIDTVRVIHHGAGAVFTVLLLQHLAVNIAGIVWLRWTPSMLVTVKDGRDALHNIRYYVGLSDAPARCGRYSYKEKCIYWLILIGGIQMAVSGWVLLFPVAVTGYLPGQVVPASKVLHTSEAMLMFLLVATWHIYDSILSPDVFPLNRSIFTGYLDRTRMERLHPLELPRRSRPEDDAREETGNARSAGDDAAARHGGQGTRYRGKGADSPPAAN